MFVTLNLFQGLCCWMLKQVQHDGTNNYFCLNEISPLHYFCFYFLLFHFFGERTALLMGFFRA